MQVHKPCPSKEQAPQKKHRWQKLHRRQRVSTGTAVTAVRACTQQRRARSWLQPPSATSMRAPTCYSPHPHTHLYTSSIRTPRPFRPVTSTLVCLVPSDAVCFVSTCTISCSTVAKRAPHWGQTSGVAICEGACANQQNNQEHNGRVDMC